MEQTGKEWSIRACTEISASSTMKVWEKSPEGLEVLFKDASDMAKVLILGLANAKASIRVEDGKLKAYVHELSPSQWKAMWESPTCGKPIPVKKFLSMLQDGPTFFSHASGAEASSSSSKKELPSRGKASLPARGPSSGGHPDDEGRNAEGNNPDGGPSLCMMDTNGDKKLQITVILECMPGHGVAALTLSSKEESACSIEAFLEFTFSQVEQPPSLAHNTQKNVELAIASSFNLLGRTIVQEEGNHAQEENQAQEDAEEEEKEFKLGVLHDELQIHYACTSSPQALILWNFEASNEASMAIQEKTSGSKSHGWTAGGQLSLIGGHVNAASVQGTGTFNYSRASIHANERTASTTMHGASGTSFMVRDASCRNRNSPDFLACIAEHHPYLRTVSCLKDLGLTDAPGDLISSSLGRRAAIRIGGRFLMFGSHMESHKLEMSRVLGEFTCKRKRLKWLRKLTKKESKVESSLACAVQTYSVTFCVNHGFSLDTYAGGRVWWALSQVAASPIPEVIPLVEEQ